MATYRFPRMLTLLAWEAELWQGPYAAERAWAEAAPAEGLNLDFSRVEFADFGALARALLLLDAAVKSGIQVTVTLPTASVFPASERAGAAPRLAARRARARGDALAFMRQVGFISSLRAPHWDRDAVRVLDRAAAGAGEQGSSYGLPERDRNNDPYERRRVFPFRWLEPMPAAQLREAESFVAVSTGLEDLGLSRSDARTLSQTVLTELVENVAEHGGDGDRPPVALVGAIMLTAENYALHQTGVHPHMAEVAERARADSSSVLRLIVADSGARQADLAARLAPTHARRGTGTGSAQDRRRQETILAALGNPATAAAGGAGPRRGTTGLSWVARVVRSYHGAVEARTADSSARWVFGRDADGTRLQENGLSYVPGTLLELTLPTGPSPPRPRIPWGGLSTPGAAPRLQWVSCAFDPQRGLADADRVRLADQMRASYGGRRADGLMVTVPLHGADDAEVDDRWRGALYQLLEFASSIARWGPVVIAFPDAEPHILDPCVAAFNEEVAAGADEDVHDPFLVVGRHGEPAWCGGSVPLRAVLTLLSQEEGAVDADKAGKCWQQAGGEPSGLSGTLQANRHLLSVGARQLKMRLSLSVVHQTVAREVSQHLAEAIDRGGDGVVHGTFRGPTLRLTNRWIYPEELLAGTVGVQLAAFVLARKVEAALRASAQRESQTGIVLVGSAPRLLARHVSECLTLDGRYYQQQLELNIDEPPIGEQVPTGAKAVLVTSLISTENTVRRAVAMVAGRDAEPLVIACVLDARARRGPVRLLNRAIPVVSLAEVNVGSGGKADEAVTNIDPLMLQPEVPAYAEAAPAQGVDLLTWFAAAPDVLRLGHIDQPPRRHYSAFVKLEALLQQEPRNEITDAVLANVKRALIEIRDQANQGPDIKTPIALWYITSDGNAERMAEIVHGYLGAEGFHVGAVTQIPRWIVGDTWAFPASLSDVTRPVGVLIIHWWAITGSTLLQLVRLAVKSGASWVAAVCMLNQLSTNDADALRMLRAVSVPTAADAGGARATDDRPVAPNIPVAIRFVAASSITAFDAHGCPVCATRDRYQLDDDAAPPRLINHAELLRDMLRPRELEEVARDTAADLFTVPVTSGEALDYMRWRGLLLLALRKVGARQEVMDRLRALTVQALPEAEWTSDGLIRLLAAEQQWLRLPPLYFEMAAELLSRVCVNSFERLTAPSWLRVQALMVMSAAAPQRLVDLLPRLLASAGNEAILIDQMLLDCCRLLLRAPGNLPIDLVKLRHNLLQCRDYLEEQRSDPDATATDEHLHAVRSLLTIADYRILTKPEGPQAAWERLREDLVRPVMRHRLEARLLLVRSFVEDIDQVQPSDETARAAEADWDACAKQLEERALANLRPLREILDGDFVSDWLGTRDQRRLLTLARPDLGRLRAITDSLHILAHGPWRPADPSWQATRRELLGRLHWWNRIFLAAHMSDHEMPALLVELIRSAPVKLGPCVEELLESHQARATFAGTEHGQVEVFCPERLLGQIVAHLLENIEKHRTKGAACRLHVEYLPPDENAVRMVARNSGTVACTPPGRGLRALNDKLRPFGGSLIGNVPAEGEWTFAAIATLPLWHGG